MRPGAPGGAPVPGFTAAHRGGAGAPMVCLHGFLDSWRTWELVLPALERHHDVLAPTLGGHAGGPRLTGAVGADALADGVERAMDAAGFATAHLVGNSLGGHVALRLAERGRARSVVALAPAGGWETDDPAFATTLAGQRATHAAARLALPQADRIAATAEGRRRATAALVESGEHLSPELVVGLMAAAAACDAGPLVDAALRDGVAGYRIDAERITCPVRIVWGTADRLLPWPSAAVRLRRDWLPHADWVVLDGVGHAPQLDVPVETAALILGLTAP